MSIPFTQYLRPDGRTRAESISRSPEIEALARRWIDAGGKFEAEVLTTGHVSLSAAMRIDEDAADDALVFTLDGEWHDVVMKICANGPQVLDAVDELVREAAALLPPEAEPS